MGVKPDIITMAKSLSGMGLPMALVLVKPELDQWSPGEHNGTFRGNCHAFVTAKAAIDTFWSDDRFAAEVQKKGERLRKRLREIALANRSVVKGIKGRGMMCGLDVGSSEVSDPVVDAAFKRGLIIETSGAHDQILKVLAPLNITDADLDAGLDILADCVAEVAERQALGSAA